MEIQVSNIYRDTSVNIEDRINNLLEQMTLPEKIGQMTQVEKNSITPEQVVEYYIGSVLSGGGGNPDPNTAEAWAAMVQEFASKALETRLGIPLIYGVDGVHGHSNVRGATIFPHNIGLGATRDADLLERIARATARELLATNVHWDFAPAVSVPQDIRWGRIYEGYSEQTAVVQELGMAFIRGLKTPQLDETWVLPSVKHFAADGGAMWGTSKRMPWLNTGNWQGPTDLFQIDQGDAQIDEATLRTLHLAPYKEAVESGVLNIMVSFSSWNGTKMHGNRYLLTDVLKNEFGFKGFLVSDWMAVDQLYEDFYACVVETINAGMDMVMVPYDFKRFITTLTDAVNNGDISQERIDDAVRRILLAKFHLGLFETPLTNLDWLKFVGSDEHRAIAREAVQKSLVLLKNEKQTLPLPKEINSIYVAGLAANDVGLACGGWTIDWQGGQGATTKGSTLLEGLKFIMGDVVFSPTAQFSDAQAEIGIVTIAEPPYAEGMGDKNDLNLTDEQKSLITETRKKCDKLLLIIYSGRPLIITDVIDQCDAVVAAWLPGTEANAIADVLVGDVPFTGKLSYNWLRNMNQVPVAALLADDEAPLFPFGYGLSL